MITDKIADTLTRIRNAQQVNLLHVDCKPFKSIIKIINVLKNEGYVKDYKLLVSPKIKDSRVRVFLKYYNNKPVINIIERVSRPSVRVYTKINLLTPYMNGLGIYILSTSKGIVSDREARQNNIGGEILCRIF